jgi:type II secretory pathway pseudopilin PulG
MNLSSHGNSVSRVRPLSGGFSLVEILMASAIICLSIFAITASSQKSVVLSNRSLNQVQSSFLLEEGAEAVKIIRDNSWTTIAGFTSGTTYYPTFSGGTWTLSTTPTTIGFFTRTVVFSDVYRDGTDKIASSGGTLDSRTKKVTVTVVWPSSGTTLSNNIIFYITDLFN